MAEAEAVFGNLDCSNPSSHTIVCGGGGGVALGGPACKARVRMGTTIYNRYSNNKTKKGSLKPTELITNWPESSEISFSCEPHWGKFFLLLLKEANSSHACAYDL